MREQKNEGGGRKKERKKKKTEPSLTSLTPVAMPTITKETGGGGEEEQSADTSSGSILLSRVNLIDTIRSERSRNEIPDSKRITHFLNLLTQRDRASFIAFSERVYVSVRTDSLLIGTARSLPTVGQLGKRKKINKSVTTEQ